MTDYISRQAAIDAIQERMDSFRHADCEWAMNAYNGACECAGAIKSLPSAQPETIRCKDCKHRREDECPMYHVEWVEYDDDGYIESDDVIYDYTEDDGYCHMAEKREDEE